MYFYTTCLMFTYSILHYKPWLWIVFLTFLIANCNSEDKKEEEIRDMRAIVQQYNSFPTKEAATEIYNSSKSIEDINQRIGHKIAYYNFTQVKSNSEVIDLYESIINSDQFYDLNEVTKFYLFYFLSYKYNDILQGDQAFQYNIKANNYIKNNINLYLQEKLLLQNLISVISAREFDNNEELIKISKASYKRLLKEGNKVRAMRFAYNIAVYSLEEKMPQDVIKYAKIAIKIIPEINEHHLYIDSYSLLATAYEKVGKTDSALYIQKLMQNQYKSKKISESDYYKFMTLFLKNEVSSGADQRVLAHFDSIMAYLPKGCSNRYLKSIAYKDLANLYKKRREIQKEKKALEQMLLYTQSCGPLNEYFVKEQIYALDELIAINLKLGIKDNLNKWFNDKNKIEKIKQSQTNLFVHLTQYLSEQDIEYAKKDLAFQEEKIANTKKTNRLYSVLIVLFILASSYIIYLFLKNQKFENFLKNTSKKLQIQNRTINLQNKQMKELVGALKDSNENLHNFAKVAAHDIKSPLATIHNAISYIYNKYQSKIIGDDKEIFEYLNQSTVSLNNMINVLLEYSSQDKNIDKNQKINIPRMIEKSMLNLKNLIEEKKATIDFPKIMPHIRANEVLMEQLFQNIIKNALKFHKPNQSPYIDITYEIWDNKKILIKIKDQGIGIKKEHQKLIFKVFQKFHTHTEQYGNGIGLAICKKIVDDFEGEIWVESIWGESTTFFFTLPLYDNSLSSHLSSIQDRMDEL